MSTCWLYQFFALASAWLLDAVIGDPEKLPHPVRAIGSWIQRLETAVPRFIQNRKFAGVVIGVVVPATAYAAVYCILELAGYFGTFFMLSASAIIIYYCLATRCLAKEAEAVHDALKTGDIALARQKLSRIVGRDTADLSQIEIARATIETVSENTVDGIISPLFYAGLGGAPLAMAFKAVSTLDSMIGYKNTKYRQLGWFSARLDDVLNYFPARLCLVLVPLASLFVSPRHFSEAFKTGRRDGRKSPSPNSGFPEACFAGALGIQLGGQCAYAGVISCKPVLGDKEREISVCDIQNAVRLMWIVSGLSLGISSALMFMISLFWGY